MNETRFTGKAEVYNKYRSSYPKAFIDYLYTQAGFSKDSAIADIGSGTGILSRLLLERGSRVYGVEPNDDMRHIAERDFAGSGNFISVKATAEATGLPDKSMDFVTAGQAFHWFDRALFQAECRRILKPGGKAVFVWYIRDSDFELVKKDYVIREKYCVDTKGLGESGGPPKDLPDFFADGLCEVRTFRNDRLMDRDAYIGMNLSRSYSPNENNHPEKYSGFVRELGALFDEYSANGIIQFPQITKSYAGAV